MAEIPTSEEEMDIAFMGPAISANKFYVSIGQGGVRLAFCEQWASSTNQPAFRSAVLLNFQDAIELYKLLQSMLKDVEMELDKMKVPNGTN